MFNNTQSPSPRHEGIGLNVHSIFFTFQGEGPFAGRPAVFVRLHGCNLQCPQCDTDYTSASSVVGHATLAQEVSKLYTAHGKPLIVITGGEPFRQPIVPFMAELESFGCRVQVETNGTLLQTHAANGLKELSDLWIVCSPKTGRVNTRLRPFISAYKYVVTADQVRRKDGLPLTALGHLAAPYLARPPKGFPVEWIYVQPVDPDPGGANLEACIQSCYKFGYSLCLQQHKIIGVP